MPTKWLSGPNNTLSLPNNGTTTTINTAPNTSLTLTSGSEPGSAPTYVNLNVAGTLNLNLTTFSLNGFNHLHTQGGTINFIGANTLTGGTQTFNDPLTGQATLYLSALGTAITENMEIKSSASPSLIFDLKSGGTSASLQIDHPSLFHSAIVIDTPAAATDITFLGLHVTNASFQNDILSMFNGTHLVDTVNLTNASTGKPLQLEQTNYGVSLSTGSGDQYQLGGPGHPIPITL